ncbi:hypothetical protein ECG_03199 [Echinococcus granulosus]|nr:hypothetical protein ECG_03199 [Echinococcus granulosus]
MHTHASASTYTPTPPPHSHTKTTFFPAHCNHIEHKDTPPVPAPPPLPNPSLLLYWCQAEQVLRFVRPRLKDCRRGLVALIFKAYSVHRDDDRVLSILVSILKVVMANG